MLSPTPLPTKLDALAGKTILIVDDSEIAREGLAAVLEREGAKPLLAANGREALELLESALEPPDLILLDMLLPVMDGWQFMEKRRSSPTLASIPVVMVTALGAASWKWASSLGAVGLIRKPIEVEQLVRTIQYCFREGTDR
jgi:CheY-like chemotaxis protein